MSMTYHVLVKLDAKLTAETIGRILENANLIGMHFFKSFCIDEIVVSTEEAIRMMLCGDTFGDRFLDVKYQDAYITVCFSEYEGVLGLMFSSLSTNWSKTFDDGEEDVDVGRYTKLLLELVKDFSILKLEAKKG